MSNSTTTLEDDIAANGIRNIALSAVFVARLMHGVTANLSQTHDRLVSLTAVTREVLATATSSTESRQISPELKAQLDKMLSVASTETIEDGMPNAITENLQNLISREFMTVLPAISALLESGRVDPFVGAEMLKELGRHSDAVSHSLRLWILENSLFSSDPVTRDGAGLGLARLGDADAISYLESAINREVEPSLREDLELVLRELREAHGRPAATSN